MCAAPLPGYPTFDPSGQESKHILSSDCTLDSCIRSTALFPNPSVHSFFWSIIRPIFACASCSVIDTSSFHSPPKRHAQT